MKQVFILLSILLVAGVGISFTQQQDRDVLTVAFLDVGQGDATFIETPGGVQVLIDGGPNGSVLRELGEVQDFSDRDIDIVLVTHPDKDHIAGLIDVFDRYRIISFGGSSVLHESVYADALEEALTQENTLEIIPIIRGEIIDLGSGVLLEVLFPDRSVEGIASNDGSVIVRLVYGDTSFMLTGDSPAAIENFLVQTSCDICLQSTVLKAGHHGSKTSSSSEFLKAVSPEVVVFSAGEDNRYGHPNEEVVSRIEELGAVWLGTYRDGRVVLESDGKKVWRK